MRLSRLAFAKVLIVTVALLAGAAPRSVVAAPADPTAADLLPKSTLFYMEIERPKDLLDLVIDHPLRKRLEQSSDYRAALDNPKLKELRAIVAAVEQRSGVSWRKALEATAGGGVAVAIDARTQGLVILARAEERTTADKVRDALIDLAREDAAAKGNPDPVGTKEYRGLTAYTAGEGIVGNLGSWVAFSNKPDLARAVADAFLDGANADRSESLSGDAEFARARGERNAGGEKRCAWAFLRLTTLRAVAPSHPAFDASAKSDNPVAELMFGGLAGPLRNAPYATASLVLDRERMKLSVSSPNDAKWVESTRKFFFSRAGEDGEGGGGAPEPLRPKRTILSASAYRDLAAWWAAGPDLLSEGAAAGMAQADSGISNFLGGKTFGGDVLGAFRPQINLVVAAQDYKAAEVPEPTVKLPAFGLVLRLKPKEAAAANLRKHFRLGFQSLVTLTNLEGAAKGRPMLAVTTEKRGASEIISASYDAEMMMEGAAEKKAAAKDAAGADAGANANANGKTANAEQDIHFNFSPAVVISKNHLILTSTRQLAEDLAALAEKEGPAENLKPVAQNTLVEVSAAPIAELVRANQGQLVQKSMLEKGKDRAAAEKEVAVLQQIVEAARGAKFSLTPTDDAITLELEVTINAAR